MYFLWQVAFASVACLASYSGLLSVSYCVLQVRLSYVIGAVEVVVVVVIVYYLTLWSVVRCFLIEFLSKLNVHTHPIVWMRLLRVVRVRKSKISAACVGMKDVDCLVR